MNKVIYPPGDFHIHTNLRPFDDGADNMRGDMIAVECRKRGFTAFGLSPHWHFDAEPQPMLEFLAESKRLAGEILPMFCGAEAECIDENGTLTIPREVAAELDYLIVSADHFNCTGVVRPPERASEHFLFHLKLLLKLAQDPLVDIVAHPLIAVLLLTVDGHMGERYEVLENLPEIPETWLDEFASALRENHTAIEINGFFTSTWLRRRQTAGHCYESRYYDFFKALAEKGVLFSAGSDAHNIESLSQYDRAAEWLKRLEIPQKQLWNINQ